MSAFQAALREGEASDASIEERARSARAASDSPNTSRATSYWATRRERNSSGSSAASATVAPADNRIGSGTCEKSVYTPRCTFDVGHTSRAMPASTTAFSRSGSSLVRTPCPRRAGAKADTTSRTEDGPRSSPPCGTPTSPARRAMRNAGANEAVEPTRSSFDRPKATTSPGPSPANDAASRASVRASNGCFMRDAATITPISTPVSREAARASSMMISSAGVMPPT